MSKEGISGRFIVFEGGEGSGKTTQSTLLVQRLVAAGHNALWTREPGGTPIAEQIRELIFTNADTLWPTAETMLFMAARAQHVEECIAPNITAGVIVVCDRFFASTIAHQGYGQGRGIRMIRTLNGYAAAGIHPDLTILLDVPADIGLKRKAGTNINLFDQRDLAYHERVRQAYLMQYTEATHQPAAVNEWHLIDATNPPDVVATNIDLALRIHFGDIISWIAS